MVEVLSRHLYLAFAAAFVATAGAQCYNQSVFISSAVLILVLVLVTFSFSHSSIKP